MSTSVKPAHHTPTSFRDGDSAAHPKKLANPQIAAGLALSMSWQLLVAVVVPIWGGHLLDDHFGTTNHAWMIAGMVVALAAMVAIVVQTMRALNELNGTTEDDR